jgi:hypothetical protein
LLPLLIVCVAWLIWLSAPGTTVESGLLRSQLGARPPWVVNRLKQSKGVSLRAGLIACMPVFARSLFTSHHHISLAALCLQFLVEET